ncbi:MAG: hypothetical protein GTN76_15830 [Candidatus Aenigmarchaeota archaeon]|nr:hypothetical protein [Candidatus Aenigmarchaeota archaeon]
MSIEHPFPYIRGNRERELYDGVLQWKISSVKLDDVHNILNVVGFSGSGEKVTREREMVLRYIQSKDSQMSGDKILDLLEENLTPGNLADERLYSIGDVFRILKKHPNAEEIVEALREDGTVRVFEQGKTHCVLGKDVPYVCGFIKKLKPPRRKTKYDYPLIGDGIEYENLDEVAIKAGVSCANRLRKIIDENEELREKIYRTSSSRRVVKKEEVEDVMGALRAILQRA